MASLAATCRSGRSASMAKARPRRAPAAVVAEPPADGSGAVDPARSRAAEARSTWTATAPRSSGSSATADGDSSASRASRASVNAGTVRRRQAPSAAFRLRDTRRRITPMMASTRTTTRAMSPQGVVDEVVVVGAVVVVVVVGWVVVVVVGAVVVVVVGTVVVVAGRVVVGATVVVASGTVVVVVATSTMGAPTGVV